MLTSKVFIFLGILVIGIGVIFLWERSKKNSGRKNSETDPERGGKAGEPSARSMSLLEQTREQTKENGTENNSLPFNLNDIQDAVAKKDREPLSPEAQEYANELIKELEHNKMVLKDCMENPDQKADFKLETYYGTIKQIELLDNDLIAKIVVLYSNLELFKGQKIKPEDAKVQSSKIEKLISNLTDPTA